MQDQMARLHRAAEFLRQARSGPRPADLPPGLIPASSGESYQLQDLVTGGDGIGGWKILATAGGDDYACAALARPMFLGAADSLLIGERHPEIELEVAIRITSALPARTAPYTGTEVAAALGTAHAAFEVVESRFADRKQAHPLSNLADAQSSRAVAIGSGTTDWRQLDLPALPLELDLDGTPLARGQGGASVTQIEAALVWLANHASRRGCGLSAGQYVITGARIGPLRIPAGHMLEARVPGVGTVSLRLG